MRMTYDSEVDTLSTRFLEATVTTQHVAEGIAVDYTADGRITGIESLDARERSGDPEVFRRVILEGNALAPPSGLSAIIAPWGDARPRYDRQYRIKGSDSLTYRGIVKGRQVELEDAVTLPEGTRVRVIPEESIVIIARNPSFTLKAWLQEARLLRAPLPMRSDSVEILRQLREERP